MGPNGPVLKPDGSPYSLTAPDGASREQIMQAAQRAFATLTQTQPAAAAEVQQQAGAPFTTAGVEGLQQAGGMLGEFAKQEALPIAAAAGVGTLFPPAAPTAGLATRAALSTGRMLATGAAGLGGAEATRKIRGQPPMGPWERATEFVFSMAPEPPMAGAVDPSTVQRLVDGLGGAFGKAGRTDVGIGLQERLFNMRHGVSKELDTAFDAVRAVGDRLNLITPIAPETAGAITDALDFAKSLPQHERDAIEKVLQPIAVSGLAGVKFSTLSEAVRDISKFESRLRVGSRDIDAGPLEAVNMALREEAHNLARGTAAERQFAKAKRFLVGDYLPTLKSMQAIEAGRAMPTQVVQVLAKDPDKLRLIMKRLPEAEQHRVRAAYFTGLLENTKDLAHVDDIKKLTEQWNTLDPIARNMLGGGKSKDVNRIFELLQARVRQEKIIQQVRLAQSAVLVVSGSALGAALSQGDTTGALPVLFGTSAGVQVMARIMSNPAARRLFRQGLETPGRLGARAMMQALARGGVDFVAPEARLPGMGQTPGTIVPFEAQPSTPVAPAQPLQ